MHEIRARCERARVVVADHEAREPIALDAGERVTDCAQHSLAQRVHLAVKLETCHAVAEIEQAGVAAVLEDFLLRVQRGQRNGAWQFVHGSIRTVQLQGRSVDVEAPLRFLQQIRLGESFPLQSVTQEVETDHVHLPVRSRLPRVAPLHRPVHARDVVGDLRRPLQDKMRQPQKVRTREFAVRPLHFPYPREAFGERQPRERAELLRFHLLLRHVLERAAIEGVNVLPDFLVEASPGLLAQLSPGDQLLHPVGKLEILSGGLRQLASDMIENVEARQIRGSERR